MSYPVKEKHQCQTCCWVDECVISQCSHQGQERWICKFLSLWLLLTHSSLKTKVDNMLDKNVHQTANAKSQTTICTHRDIAELPVSLLCRSSNCWRKLQYLDRTHTDTGRTRRLQQVGLEPILLWRCLLSASTYLNSWGVNLDTAKSEMQNVSHMYQIIVTKLCWTLQAMGLWKVGQLSFPNEINPSEPKTLRLFLEHTFSGAGSLVKLDVLFITLVIWRFPLLSMTAVWSCRGPDLWSGSRDPNRGAAQTTT